MITEKKDKKFVEPTEEENVTLAEIVENEEDKNILEPVKTIKSDDELVTGIVTSKIAYVRQEPKPHTPVLLFLKHGETVVIDTIGSTDDYYKISGNISGYTLKSDIAVN